MNSSFSKLERVFRVNIDQLTPIDIVNMVFIDDNGINIEDRFIKIENKRKFVESSYRIQFAFPFLNLFNSVTILSSVHLIFLLLGKDLSKYFPTLAI